MASMFALFLIFNLASLHVLAKVVLEEGYTVSTLINGYKLSINPHSVLPRSGSSDLIILDSVNSVFYTVSFLASQGSAVKRLSGEHGVHEYSDGELGSAHFNKPLSFAVDPKGNVYVAEAKNNRVIRKISDSGVTTIAGGYTTKAGHQDGPAQNASFSDDFELSFIPEQCALLISDHGNQLVRKLHLKPEDCASGSTVAMGAISTWALGLGLSCLIGFIVGFAVRPYITSRGGSSPLYLSKTWKHCLILLEKPVRILCFDMKSAVASSSHYALLRRLFWLILSHLTLLFRISNVRSSVSHKDSVSLIDSDVISSNNIKKCATYEEQLKDLKNLDGSPGLSSMTDKVNQDHVSEEGNHVFSDCRGKIDAMMQAHVMDFAAPSKETTPVEVSSLVPTAGLVKRRST